MTSSNFEALVIKNINFKDSDKIYTLFVRDLGKVSCKAKGVRKFSSKRMSSLDTLNFLKVGIYGSGDLRLITETKLIHSFNNIKNNLFKLKTSYYLIEIINRTLYEDSDSSKIFDLLLKCLKRLEETNYTDTRIENFFEYHFLKLMGYSLNISSCSVCNNKIGSGMSYGFSFDNAGVVCLDCSNSLLVLSTLDLEAFMFLEMGIKVSNLDFKKVDEILKYYITEIVGSSLKSQKFLSIT